MRKTKIIATLGPRWSNEEMVKKIIENGANVCRLNFSFGSYDEHLERINIIRKVSDELGKPVAILADLQGPKIRIGKLKENITVKEGDIVKLSGHKETNDESIIPTTHENIAHDVKSGSLLLIADGTIQLIVESSDEASKLVVCKVITGGTILSSKGINLPGAHVTTEVLTEKDVSDALFAAKNGANYLGMSFVRRAEDVIRLRKILDDNNFQHVGIVSKIENTESLENLESIIKVSDGVMVARGDLGVEIPFGEVPVWQKKILKMANDMGKITIIATQMLESMTKSPVPSRAEASDVANAVLDGTDVVMMSAETASGDYPIESVKAMVSIVEAAEKSVNKTSHDNMTYLDSGVNDALADSASYLSYSLDNKAIIALSRSGRTVRNLSKKRPKTPIVFMSADSNLCNGLAICHNVYTIHMPEDLNFSAGINHGGEINILEDTLVEHKLAEHGDRIIVVSGSKWQGRWQENSVRIVVMH
ncbi:pyruvate kinase [Brachyspira pilosicoli]|uniref:Pyruvate kinase n=5 Tax=Brachyspira TaxID=29521 RepID=D8IBL3_BRAP9|nr:pyruvate kinase [Brachyspira pilosicoli]ADK30536.1 pyruvate kinase [Brachyspira pilosicoli 95/1000]AFR70182.1 pyruvate kinase [Brachyspira pilosicoli B2904]AGA65431.1 pyruvate kinase [Brachyspira pilosicoli P43/6/78]MBW5378393.1 pyruvate kinase [Brachyspira pilosicoli]MBW5381755.1 pyruvate kinase [Brachyspira pilosicoli]